MLPFSLTPTTALYSVIPIPYFLNLPPTKSLLLLLLLIVFPPTTTSKLFSRSLLLSLIFSSLFFSYNGSSRLNIRIRRAPEIPVEKIPFWNFRFRQTRIFSSFFAQSFEVVDVSKAFKIWNSERTTKKSVVATNLQDLVSKGKLKLGLTDEAEIRLVLETDGTDVDDEDYFSLLPNDTVFVLLESDEQWHFATPGDSMKEIKEVMKCNVKENNLSASPTPAAPIAPPTPATPVAPATPIAPATPTTVTVSGGNNSVRCIASDSFQLPDDNFAPKSGSIYETITDRYLLHLLSYFRSCFSFFFLITSCDNIYFLHQYNFSHPFLPFPVSLLIFMSY
ncbi:DFFA [Acanthosepion pharaonis]|uniref:DFFA n=1 Tax=Acanthosepion pharaonis TaxID=158019 RepID=A0A812EL76_ACAPH|nr:DFFA [Sepia pharaonis]